MTDSDLRTVQGVSFPRSGSRYLVELLFNYFRALDGFDELPPSRIPDDFVAAGPFSWCEHYTCCESIPCARGAVFRKNHDFGSELRKSPETRYLIQYRHPVPTILSDFEKNPLDLDWSQHSRARAVRWNEWMTKWVVGPRRPETLLVFYDDLVRHTRREMVRVLRHFGHEARADLIPERGHFLRRNLDGFDVSHVQEITRPVREALGMPELPEPASPPTRAGGWTAPVIRRR